MKGSLPAGENYSPMYHMGGAGEEGGTGDLQDRDRQEFLLLLVTLLPLQIIYPVLSGGPSERPGMVLFFSLLLIAGVWIMRGSRSRFLMAAILTLVSLELLWISLWPAASSLLVMGEFFLLMFLILLAGRMVSTFIRTSLPVTDLLIAATSLFFLIGTILGLGLYLISGIYPAGSTGIPGNTDLASSLSMGIAILTTNGTILTGTGQVLPLIRVVCVLGMIGGILLITLIIGKIGSVLLKKDSNII